MDEIIQQEEESEKSVQNRETPNIQGAAEEGEPKKGEKKVTTREENRRRGHRRGQMKKMFQEIYP